MRSVIIAVSLLVSFSASAQDTVNAHNFQLVPNDGDLTNGLGTWTSEKHEEGSISVNFMLEHGKEPLSLVEQNSAGEISTAIIENYSVANLGLFYALTEDVAVTVSAPLFLEANGTQIDSRLGIGDFRIATPIILLTSDENTRSLSVVPFLDIPGSYGQNNMGLSEVAGGGIIAGSLTSEKFFGSANLGLQFAPKINYHNLRGGERIFSSLMGGVMLDDDLALRGEIFFKPTLYKNDQPMSDSPLEAMLSLKGQTGNHLSWTLAGSSALSESVGAPIWRVIGGIDVAFGARNKSDCEPCRDVLLSGSGVFNSEGERINGEVIIRHLFSDGSKILTDRLTEVEGGAYAVGCTVSEELVVITDDELILMEPIYFDFDKATIRFPESQNILNALIRTLHAHPELTLIEVAGHTDSRGSHEYNQNLSQARVNSVVEYLTSHGIERRRLIPVGYGEERLLEDCFTSDEECHQKNRRVQFSILGRE